MKKYLFLLILPFLFLNNVHADTLNLNYNVGYWSWVNVESYSDLESFITENSSIISRLKNNALEYYNTNYASNYPYYIIGLMSSNSSYGVGITLSIQAFPTIPTLVFDEYSANASLTPANSNLAFIETQYIFENTTYISPYDSNTNGDGLQLLYYSFSNTSIYNDYFAIEKNFDLIYDNSSFYDTVNISNFRGSSTVSFSKGGSVPISVSDMTNINYSTVDLDNYNYVILSLKNYNQKQPFSSTLQVKGSIGITPVYNFGQSSKDSIIGSQVQDRCNLTYDNYTPMSLFIINSDLQNNAVYYVKSCSSGSSFKFDNSVFDVTYITNQNADSPTVTIGGTTYNTLPYNDLPSTATQNEEDNYIPGESGSATDTGGLDSAIKNIQQKMSEIWNTFTYFTQFINQMFSVLPVELRTVLVSAFIIAIILGLIKIFIN